MGIVSSPYLFLQIEAVATFGLGNIASGAKYGKRQRGCIK